MSAITGAFALLDVARELHAVGQEHDEADEAEMASPEGSLEQDIAHKNLMYALDQDAALHDLGLSIRPNTLSEAAVQLSILFSAISRVGDSDLASQLRAGDLERDLTIFRRVIGGLARVVSTAAGIDLGKTGPIDAVSLIDHHCPAGDMQ